MMAGFELFDEVAIENKESPWNGCVGYVTGTVENVQRFGGSGLNVFIRGDCEILVRPSTARQVFEGAERITKRNLNSAEAKRLDGKNLKVNNDR